MTSDVGAAKGDDSQSVSNYWRPVFVLWLIINHRVFGISSAIGWHLHPEIVAARKQVAAKFGLRGS